MASFDFDHCCFVILLIVFFLYFHNPEQNSWVTSQKKQHVNVIIHWNNQKTIYLKKFNVYSSLWLIKTSPPYNYVLKMQWAELILQPFHHFTYITAHSPTLPSLYLHHSSFSYPSDASPTSQLILQPFFCFSYVTDSSLTSPGEPPMFSTVKI